MCIGVTEDTLRCFLTLILFEHLLVGLIAGGFGLVKGDEANIQQYVTARALDGLYRIIGEEEKKIRQDPVGTGSAILKKVFGGLG